MDDILQTVKLEVTLDCMQGSSLSQVWSYVELAQRRLLQRNGMDPEPVSIDVLMKRYLWPYIVKLPEMTFINEGTVIYNSTAPIAQSTTSGFLLLSADEVESQYPDLTVHASPRLIYKELFGREEGNEKLLRSTQAFTLIQALSRSREKGITQVQLSKSFGLDPRSTFHFLRVIDREGLLTKTVTYDHGITTNLWVLRRFATDGQDATDSAAVRGNAPVPNPSDNNDALTVYLVSNELRKRVVDVLETTETGYMLETDLMDVLKLDIWSVRHRRYFHRALRDLVEGKFVEQMQLPIRDAVLPTAPPGAESMDVDKAEAAKSASSSKTKKSRKEYQAARQVKYRTDRGLEEGYSYRRCVRFLRPYVEKVKARARVGVPLNQSTRERSEKAASATQDDGGDNDGGISGAIMAESDTADNEGGRDSSSDEDELDIETLKEKDDLRYMLTKNSVQVGALAMLPPEAQVFRLIAIAGSHGIVSRAIQFLLKWTSLRPLTRCLTRLEQTPVFLPDGSWPGVYTSEECKQANREHLDEMLIESVEEFMGREHRKRFFVNPLARVVIESLTAYSDMVAAQQLAALPQQALLPASTPTASGGAAATVAAPDCMDGQNACRDSPRPGSAAAPLENGQSETQPAAIQAPAEVAEAEAAALVLADMAECNSFEDIYAEAKNRKVPLNNIVREYVILGMLKREAVFSCNLEQVMRCDRAVKQYVRANMDSPAMTPTLANTMLNHTMDKRTFQRTIIGLSDQKRIWYQTVGSLPDVSGPNAKASVYLAIARDTDPNGAIVSTYIAQLRDVRRYNRQITIPQLRRIPEIIPIPRTEGAEERDVDYLLRKMDTEESRAQGIKNLSLRTEYGQRHGDLSSSKRARDENGNPIIKRARVSLLGESATENVKLTEWQVVEKRLQHIPRRIGRAKDLYDFLAHNLAESVDNDYVFANCAFRSSFLFYRLPLELFLEVTGGISYFQQLLPYIRYGICTRVDGRRRGSAAEAEVSDAQSIQASSLESINLRLATPLYMLPPTITKMIDKRIIKTRLHLQMLMYMLYVLQLVRPVENVKDIMSLPPPPDAKDAFASEPVRSPKILGFGYQLIGKTHLLSQKGYSLALNAYNTMAKHRLDLTTCYLNSNVYNMLDSADAFRYWGDLQQTAMTEASKLPPPHILFGVGKAYYWVLDISLDGKQTQALDSFVDKKDNSTPLNNPDILADAAKCAGTSLEEARRYFQHKHSKMVKKGTKTLCAKKRREKFVGGRVKKAKETERLQREQREQREEAESRARVEAGDSKATRVKWNDEGLMRVAVYYAVLQDHARAHRHTFVMQKIGNLFPNCQKSSNPSESVRQCWRRMKKNSRQCPMVKKVAAIWKYAFLDAVAKGDLDDDSDLNSFDYQKAIGYYCDLLQRETVDALFDRYSDAMAKDGFDFDTLEFAGESGGSPWSRAARRKSKSADDADADADADAGSEPEESRQNVNRIYKLPATLLGKEAHYRIDTKGRNVFNLAEEVVRESISGKVRLQSGSNVMLTTHAGWECTTDHSSPCTVLLSTRHEQAESDRMDVDGETPAAAEVTVVSRGSSHLPYATILQRHCHLERTFDANSLVSRIGELTLSSGGEAGGERVPAAEIGDAVVSQRYAELASLLAMVANLAITPADEYDVGTGHRLLEAKTNMAQEAHRLAMRSNVITELKGMSASTGLGVQSTDTAPDSADADAGALAALTSALKSTTVAYETTGMMRIAARPVAAKVVADKPDADEANGSADEGAHAEAHAGDDGQPRKSRKVPGRGCGPSDKFLSTIKATRSGRFASSLGLFGEAGSVLDEHLGPAEFEQLCWLVGRGKLWLRPRYNRRPNEPLLSALAGFKKQNSSQLFDYTLKIAYVDYAADSQVRGDLVDDAYQRSTSKASVEVLLPTGDSLAAASRIAVGVIHEMGALGASEHELLALLATLLAPDKHATAAAALPSDIRLVLTTRSQLSALLHLLAREDKLHVVGNHDLRYVSKDAYSKYWSLRLEGIEHTFEPYVGQNMSGTVNTTYTLGMLTALVSHIVDNPGIPQFMLIRRFFAPVISRKEVLSYLRQLVDMGIVVAETLEAPLSVYLKSPGFGTTHYYMAPDYRHRITQLTGCWASNHLNRL